MRPHRLLITALLLCAAATTHGQNSPQLAAWGDDLVATDALGRTLPRSDECPAPRANHYVGLFYWLWHGPLRNTTSDDVDVTKILAHDPSKTDWRMEDYFWAKPELGYYRSADPWVIRKHLSLFALVGIDFLYLDFTNDNINAPELQTLLRVILEMKAQGYPVPRVVGFLNHEPNHIIEELYDDFYSRREYADCWFYWEGRPLIMSPRLTALKNDAPGRMEAILNFFTWRPTWALFSKEESDKGRWRFIDDYPQRPAYKEGKIEQLVVSKAAGAPIGDNPKYGSSSSTSTSSPTYDQYWLAPETGTGQYFEEQWQRAHELDAPILCITGWNEWTAGAWHCTKALAEANLKFQNRKLKVGDMYFVDEFNAEFNRDLEPMAGGYTDNFFYQMAAHLRRYKGMSPREKTHPARRVSIDGKFDEWRDVSPVFRDFEGDVMERDFAGSPRGTHYTDCTGRNDIIESRVSYDSRNVYFYVKTVRDVTPCTDSHWMLLYIDSDRSKQTGWQGYDHIVNLEVADTQHTSLSHWKDGAWHKTTDIGYRVVGNQMEIAVPRAALGLGSAKFEIYFHWADNVQRLDDIAEFGLHGESAPERRYNYDYDTANR